jgi:hypothetical protein
MTSIYTQHNKYGQPPPNPKRCPAAVYSGRGFSHQCRRPRGKGPDGWCGTHEPEKIKARQAKLNARYQARMESRHERQLACYLAMATVEQLKAELKRRRK